MDYYGLLFLYYLKGLSGKSVLRLFFNIEAGGTEQLLPENTSTPTTTPILADIQYPDGLRTDQYFTYRETPTTVSNKARIKTIKGNTLVWNQLINDTGSTTTTDGITFTKNADGSITLNGTATAQADYNFARIDFIKGHKYLINGIPSGATEDGYRAFLFQRNVTANRILTPSIDDWFTPRIRVSSGVTVSNVVFRLNIFDLTKMGLDSITSVEEFTSLFPSYYAYNQGSLLSFNGNGIKTVGFNQWDEEWEVGGFNVINGTKVTRSDAIRCANYIPCIPNTTYYLSCASHTTPGDGVVCWYDNNKNFIRINLSIVNRTFTSPSNAFYMTFYIAPETTYRNDICINISDTERNGTYEPYTSSTTNLPVSTYFPTGMKSAGSLYDELTPRKAKTRISSFVINGNSVNYHGTASTGTRYVSGNAPQDAIQNSVNIKTVDYLPITTAPTNSGYIRFLATSFYLYDNAFTDLATAKSILNANPVTVYYESATPTETPITTEDANEALSLLMGRSVSSSNAKQLIGIITKGE